MDHFYFNAKRLISFTVWYISIITIDTSRSNAIATAEDFDVPTFWEIEFFIDQSEPEKLTALYRPNLLPLCELVCTKYVVDHTNSKVGNPKFRNLAVG